MAARSYASPMDWEYQHSAPMDPTSPFARSTKQAQDRNPFAGSLTFGASSQNGFGRAQTTPSKPPPSIFAGSQRTATAPGFRNPAFTTPRKPLDVDTLSELSAADSSPTATDASDFVETPDHDQSPNMAHMTIAPASTGQRRLLFPKRASGKGEIPKPIFPSRDKIRKRKRYNADTDISVYRLPYLQPGEGDSDYESDESTFQPKRTQHRHDARRRDGWLGNFLATVQRHPYAPSILGYWLNLVFSLVWVTGALWVGLAILTGLREDFAAARTSFRDEMLDEMARCRADYLKNKCSPVEQRLPAMYQLCEQWNACMNRNPDNLKKMQLGAKSIVEIVNEIADTMSYKTMLLLAFFLFIFLVTGRSLYKSAHEYPDFRRPAPPAYSQPHPSEHAVPQQVYWQAIRPQTPRHALRHRPLNDDTPETDAPPQMKALPPPETPSARRSPTKAERGRSPTRSRSPTKRY